MKRYAASTSVSVERTKSEIESTLSKYGASGFCSGWSGSKAMIGFVFNEKRVQFVLELPDKNSDEFTRHSRGWRTSDAAFKAWEQGCRQRWRALALCIKAKLEAVEIGITTFEDEFLAHIVLPSGQTAGQWLLPQIEQAYESGEMPKMLLMLESN